MLMAITRVMGHTRSMMQAQVLNQHMEENKDMPVITMPLPLRANQEENMTSRNIPALRSG